MKGAAYVESSVLLRILLEGDRTLTTQLGKAKKLVTSSVTQVEVARGLRRAALEGRITPRQHRDAERLARGFFRSCDLIHVDDVVLERAGQSFPVEPVRTLDALHLASALLWETVGSTAMFSCDRRVRENAEALGLRVLPATG